MTHPRRPSPPAAARPSVALPLLAAVSVAVLAGCAPGAKEAATAPDAAPAAEARAATPLPAPPAPPAPPKVTLSGPLIIPRPKKSRVPEGVPAFKIGPTTRVVVADAATPAELRAADVLQSEIAARFGFKPPRVKAAALKLGTVKDAILIGGAARNPHIALLQQAGRVPAAPARPEGYTVAVLPEAVVIAGRDEPGALWGAQTVVQILGDENPVVWPAVVEDWPSLKMRAAHLFHGSRALPFHRKLISRVFSRYKMNALFLQTEHLRWNHDADAAPTWAGTPAQVKQEIAYARAHGLTMYPILEGYGHLEFRLNQGNRKALAEDPATPYAINFTDPKAVTYLEKFNAEADALFDAPGFHVGMDEVQMRGRFPYRSKPKTAPELFGRAVTHWRDFYAKRGKEVFVWGDMALCATDAAPDFGSAHSPAEAAAMRAKTPKNITLVNWQYGEREEFPSVKQLKDAGFTRFVGATWYRPINIQEFTRVSTKEGALGMIQTTWCGYESHEGILTTEHRKQFTAFILAADYFWNGGEGPAPTDLPYDPARVFTREWKRAAKSATSGSEKGTVIARN